MSKNMMINKANKNNNNKKNIVIAGIAVVAIAALTLVSKNQATQTPVQEIQVGAQQSAEQNEQQNTTQETTTEATTVNVPSGENITINKADITEEAKFYGYESNGTYMELLAVRASDGTVRTALNTCQVCNNSGRGYYVQEGDTLVCQNCGNQFGVDDVEVTRNGCNPVPLEQSMKTEDDEKVVINGAELAAYEPLFAVWKN